MNNKTYDIMKWVALTGLPALITFYGVLGATLHIPYTQEVLTIAVAFNTMIGTWLGITSNNYHKRNESKLEDDNENIWN